MKKIFLILLLSLSIFASEKPKDLLNSISKHAITIGTGKTNEVYLFVDPMCKHSKALIKRINENKMLGFINTYHIFLYNLPKFESDELIEHIYQAKDKHKKLIDIMINNKNVDFDELTEDANRTQMIKNIAEVAKKLNVKKRPYMILFEGDTGYCRVSEGSAPCMEEFDFD